MEVREFTLSKEFIELNRLLKFETVVSSGGEAGVLISEGLVSVNGEVDLRKRRKIKSGDTVVVENITIKVL